MLKQDVTYEDFNGETVTDTLYFNLTATELTKLEAEYEGGLEKVLEEIIKSNDIRRIIAEFQKIILLSYGERSDDGKRFIKSDQIREEFAQTAAYDAFFMQMAADAELAANFVNGVIPKQLAAEVKKAEEAEAAKKAEMNANAGRAAGTPPPPAPLPPTND